MDKIKFGQIKDVIITDLKIIKDERGAVFHMIKSNSPTFSGFGEVYFSKVNPGIVKGWKMHTKMTQNIAKKNKKTLRKRRRLPQSNILCCVSRYLPISRLILIRRFLLTEIPAHTFCTPMRAVRACCGKHKSRQTVWRLIPACRQGRAGSWMLKSMHLPGWSTFIRK